MCQHQTPCPPAAAPDRQAAHVVAAHPEQGWSLLGNGAVVFEDTGAASRWSEHSAAPAGSPAGDRPPAPAATAGHLGLVRYPANGEAGNA